MWCEKRKNGTVKYVERYTDPLTDKVHRVSVTYDKDTTSNRKKALAELSSLIEKQTHTKPVRDDLTLSELIDKYLDYQKKTVQLSTYRRNKGYANIVLKLLDPDIKINRLNAQIVREALYCDKPSMVNERYKRFKSLIRWGYKNDYISDIRYLDKLESVTDKEKIDKLADKFIERYEIPILLNSMHLRKWRELTEFLILSGLRCGEALALYISDIDFSKRVITVTKSLDPNNDIITTPKTANSVRTIDMQDELYSLCKSIVSIELDRCKKNDTIPKYLFCDLNGNYLKYYAFNKYLKKVSTKSIGYTATTHVLRHTHVSLLAESGIPLDVIARRVGHADSEITRRIYYHITERQKEKDRELLQSISLID